MDRLVTECMSDLMIGYLDDWMGQLRIISVVGWSVYRLAEMMGDWMDW